MGIFKGKPKDEKEEADKPLDDPAEPEEVVNEEKPDRKDFNCSDCKGEGLAYEGMKAILCPKCSGTGKVN